MILSISIAGSVLINNYHRRVIVTFASVIAFNDTFAKFRNSLTYGSGKTYLCFSSYLYHVIFKKEIGRMKVYGYKYADNSKIVKRNLEYLRNNVVNHTYY